MNQRFGSASGESGSPEQFEVGAAGTALEAGIPEPSALQQDTRRVPAARQASHPEVHRTGATASGAAASNATAIGAAAVGALAIGALAVGALAIGRLAIGKLSMKRAHVRKLSIDDLEVGRLRVGELIVEPDAAARQGME